MMDANRTSTAVLEHPTRQQLDELYELMQRMLALPVNSDHACEPTVPSAAVTAHAPIQVSLTFPEPRSFQDHSDLPATPSVTPLETAPLPQENVTPPWTNKEEKVAPVDIVSSEQSMLEAEQNPVVAGPPEALAAPVTDAIQVPRPRYVALPQAAAPASVPSSMHVPLWLLPLLWCNAAYDGILAYFGPPGRWLRGSIGRAILGWSGVCMLAAALAWVALYRMGWTW